MKQCFLCGRWCNTEVHHLLFGTGLRKLADQYHLTVDLCPDCHRNGPRAVHKNAEVANALRAYGEKKWMEQTGGTVDDFIKVFGKNYLGGDNEQADFNRERVQRPRDQVHAGGRDGVQLRGSG